MPIYSYTINSELEMMKLKLDEAFKDDRWDEVLTFYKKKVEDGFLNWELDLTGLKMITSNSIGMIVALNTSLKAHTGNLQLILAQNSYVSNQVLFAGIDKLITCQVV